MFQKIGKFIKEGAKKIGGKIKSGIRKIGKGLEKAGVNIAEGLNIGQSRDKMPAWDRVMAKFADMAYENRKDFAGYTYIPDESTTKMGVWWKDSDKHLILAFRGTVITDTKDLVDDLKIVAGSEDTISRVVNGIKKAKALSSKLGATRVTFTGHSLGGAIASEVLGQISKGEVGGAMIDGWVFNPGYASVSIKPYPNWKTGLHILHISGDPISALARTVKSKSNDTYLGKLSMNAHTIKQFT